MFDPNDDHDHPRHECNCLRNEAPETWCQFHQGVWEQEDEKDRTIRALADQLRKEREEATRLAQRNAILVCEIDDIKDRMVRLLSKLQEYEVRDL